MAKTRTLENTGTCPACGRNVKLDKLENVCAHGYTIRRRRYKHCLGTGLCPTEVSNYGIERYITRLTYRIERHTTDLATLNFSAGRGEALAEELRRCLDARDEARARLANWQPSVLPGIQAGFGR